MNSQKDAYNINNYTDKELYDILDLINPSDRELEAKILHMIWKYNNFGNEDGNRLVQFYKDIYDHFFDDDEEEIGSEDEEIDNENRKEGFDTITSTNNNTIKPTETSTIKPTDNNVTTNTHQLDYVKDQLNPILKQTTKRILSIDSQYREDKSSISTDFTFNLSEILKDVLSIKLFSIQVPYTWYTINANFGSNFFYIKGNSPGINNGNHDIKFSVPIGNYTAPDLITAANKSIIELTKNPLYTDISFGKTNISYDNPSSKSNLTLDISNTYNEMYYSLYFSNWTTPNTDTTSRNDSIPAFFGFNYGLIDDPYYSFRIYSNYTILPTSSSNDNKQYYILNSTNNYFTITQYTGLTPTTEFISYPSNCTILKQFKITLNRLTIGNQYLRSDLFDELNYQLANNQYLIPPSQIGISQLGTSQINRVITDNSGQIGYTYSHYELDIILNRFTVLIQPNSKTAVQFPIDTNIWIGLTSAFVFNNSSYELSSIISETSSINTNFIINSNPYILLECINPNFIDVSNNYKINMTNSPISGYLLTDYINYINSGIQYINSSDLNIQNTNASINSKNLFDLKIDFVKQFTQKNYLMDLSGTFLNTLLNFTNIEQDLSLNNIFSSTFPISGSGYSMISTDASFIIILKPKQTDPNKNVPIYYVPPINYTTTYSDINSLENAINLAFNNYGDNNGIKVLIGTTIKLTQNVNNVDASLNVIINKNLTESDYKLIFVDLSANSSSKLTNGYGITYTNTNWIEFGTGNNNTIIYSSDGVTWTGLGTNTFNTQSNGGLWNGSKLVAVGQGGNTIAYSSDGITNWTGLGTNTFTTSGNGLNWNGQFFIALGEGGNTIAYSINGNNWIGTGETIFTTKGNRSSFDINNNWFAVGQGTNTIASWMVGSSWTGLGTNTFTISGNGIDCSNNTRYIAVGEGGNTIAYSNNNGSSWIGLGTNTFTTKGNNVVWNGKYYVACGKGGNTIAYSSDGINWNGSINANDIFTDQVNDLYWNNNINQWTAVGQGNNIIAYSSDQSGNYWTINWDLNDLNNSWANYLKIPKSTYYLNNPTDVSLNNNVSELFGIEPVYGNQIELNTTNNTIYIEPLTPSLGEGIYTGDNINSIILQIPIGKYTRDTLITKINNLFNTTYSNNGNGTNTIAYGSNILNLSLNNSNTVYSKIRLNMNKKYTISDYKIVFYDPYSFVTCFFGSNGVKNTTWDSTLGWILGYRQFTEYYFNSSQNIVTLTGDTTVSVTIYNSFMIILNDYNQNHLNDGLITTIQRPNDIPLPSYTSRSAYICDPVTKKLIIPPIKSNIPNDVNSYTNNMTQKQIYAATENYNTQQNINTATTYTNKTYYSSGPFAKDVFALVPIKLAGLANNSVFVEFGGTLQQQERTYFGPVNISRLSIKLINDKGETVDLNNANWSLSLVVEQLYQQKKM